MYDLTIPITAYLVPPEQWDGTVVPDLLDAVSDAGIAVARQGRNWLVLTDEALPERLAREMGIRLRRVQLRSSPVPTRDFHCEGSVTGNGRWLTLDPREMAAFSGVAFLLDRIETVYWAEDGTFILDSPYSEGSARAANFAHQFGLRATLTDHATPRYQLNRPRVTATPADTALLIRYGVPFTERNGALMAGTTQIEIETASPQARPLPPSHPITFGIEPGLIATFPVALAPNLITFPVRPQFATARFLLNAIYFATARVIA